VSDGTSSRLVRQVKFRSNVMLQWAAQIFLVRATFFRNQIMHFRKVVIMALDGGYMCVGAVRTQCASSNKKDSSTKSKLVKEPDEWRAKIGQPQIASRHLRAYLSELLSACFGRDHCRGESYEAERNEIDRDRPGRAVGPSAEGCRR
jgi:hypothetical protein